MHNIPQLITSIFNVCKIDKLGIQKYQEFVLCLITKIKTTHSLKMILKNYKTKLVNLFLMPFPLLDGWKSKLFLVSFCCLFSTFFILYYNPFNIEHIKYDSALGHFLAIWNAGIIGAIILSITQFLFRPIFNLSTLNLGQFILWGIFEFICICLGVYFFFGESKEPFIQEFLLIFKYTISIAFLPYIIACLLIAVAKLYLQNDQKNVLIQEKEKVAAFSPEQHLFTKEDGKVLFGIKPKQILYLKSENNYTSIYYFQNKKVERKLIRTNLKSISETFDNPNLIRIHRSYMVNLKKVEIIHREKRGFQLEIEHLPNLLLKVSDNYKHIFEEKIKVD